ncbi:MAG: enhanced serine sensitivity protein SseB C-terminal domain-containing protein [Paludibacteraceae bacterium]|nr:enhanced serine sensitivity protein SseB C-terminal domain-containing protein [Paludibacteraceae bacterium]
MGLFDFLKKKKETAKKAEEVETPQEPAQEEEIKEEEEKATAEAPQEEAEEETLESLLKKAATEPAMRPQFYKKLLDTKIIVLTDKGQNGPEELQKGTSVRIKTLKEGKIPAFTSLQRLYDNDIIKEEVPYIEITGRKLFMATKGACLVLNPFSDTGKELTPPEIQSLLDGTLLGEPESETLKEKTTIRIGKPAHVPEGLETTLIEFSKTKTDITAVYIALMEKEGSGQEPTLLIGVKLTGNEKEQEIFSELGVAIRPYAPQGKRINMAPIYENGNLSNYFNNVEPVYRN